MEREKKVMVARPSRGDEEGDGGAKRQEETSLGVKPRRGLSTAQRASLCSPMPAWKLEENAEEAGPSRSHDTAADADHCRARPKQHHRHRSSLPFPAAATGGACAAVSARKLGANLWETQDLPRSRVSRRGARARSHREEHFAEPADLSPPGPHEQQTRLAGDLGKHVAASVTQHRKSTDRNAHALQPVSPASYNSAMAVAACNQAITPTSSLDLKGRPGCGLKTSVELLRVLNRIWSLEEQHASSRSLVKALKLELECAQARIEELLQEKEADRQEIDDLTRQIMEDKLVRKSKEQERIKAAVQSSRHELEDMRRLRRLSETLHRKLAKELSEVKLAFLKTVKDLEAEKKAHSLLENLCDEFAKGVREYEQEVRELKQKSEKGCDRRRERLVLHVAEAWLDERLQMKLAEAHGDLSEKNTIINRLTCEVETFLQARRRNSSNDDVVVQDTVNDGCLRRHSLESVHFNGAVSAPQDAEDEDSVASDLHYFELNVGADVTERHDDLKLNGVRSVQKLEARKSNATKKIMGSFERFKCQSSPSSQAKLNMHAHSCNGGETQFMNRVQGIHTCDISEGGKVANQVDIVAPQKSEGGELPEDALGMKVKQESTHGSRNIIANSVTERESGQFCSNMCPGDDHNDDSCDAFSGRRHSVMTVRSNASGDFHALSSPVQQWSYHQSSPDLEIPECSSKMPQGEKDNTLKAKLLEARLEGRHARLRASRGSSLGV